MKKVFSFLLSILMLCSITAGVSFTASAAQSGDWEYTVSKGKATITYYDGSAKDLEIPSELGGYPVTAIDEYALAFTEVKSVVIPASVTTIGEGAFCFSDLESVKISNGVKTIGADAFSYCINLTTVSIPKSVQSLSSEAFSYCTSLTAIKVNSENSNYSSKSGVLFSKQQTKLLTYPAGKASSNYKIPSTVTSISASAFFGVESLTGVTIPSSVTAIGEYAFAMSGLKSVKIPSSVTSIKEATFCFCENLKSVTIPKSVTKIGDMAFAYCTALKEIKISDKVTSVGTYAFANCSGATKLTIGSGVKTLGDGAFSECSSLKSVTIPSNITSIPDYLFENCISLKSVTIPNTVTKIGEGAFYSCTALATVNYIGSKTQWGKMTIKSDNGALSNAARKYVGNCTLSKSTYTYNGKAKAPTVTVTDGKGNTISSKNYTVTYVSCATGKTVKSMKNVGQYYVKIKFKGDYSGTVKETVTIKPQATSVKSVSASSKGFTVKWSKLTTQTTGYQIQYSTSSSFSDSTTKTVSDNTKTSKKITGLKAKTKYYVRVRTYKTVKVNGKSTKIYSAWSKSKSVTTKK